MEILLNIHHLDFPGLAHQPNSLDDLDGDPLPYDDVPVRYDDNTGKVNFIF